MPMRRGHGGEERAKYGYIVEVEYDTGDLDYDSVGNNEREALSQLKNYKNERGIKYARLYPKNEAGRATGDPIATVRGKSE